MWHIVACADIDLVQFNVINWNFPYTVNDGNFINVYVVTHYNFAFCFVWVWNLVADIAGGKEAEGVWEHGVEENIWTEEGRGNGGMEETA